MSHGDRDSYSYLPIEAINSNKKWRYQMKKGTSLVSFKDLVRGFYRFVNCLEGLCITENEYLKCAIKKYGKSPNCGNLHLMGWICHFYKRSYWDGDGYPCGISREFEPFRICGRFADDFEVTVGGNDEEHCIDKLGDMIEQHGDLVWHSGYVDENYANGEYIRREDPKFD